MEWTSSEDILSEAAHLLTLNAPLVREYEEAKREGGKSSRDLRGNTVMMMGSSAVDSAGEYLQAHHPTYRPDIPARHTTSLPQQPHHNPLAPPSLPPSAVAPRLMTRIIDDRDEETKATDAILEEWMGMPNPILAAAELEARRHAQMIAGGHHANNTTAAAIAASTPAPPRKELEYYNGNFYMVDVAPTRGEAIVAGDIDGEHGDIQQGGAFSSSSPPFPPPLTEEELQQQGDAICEAVHWLITSQEKDRAIEEVETILVRARMSEVVQCEGVIQLMEDEIRSRQSTIALIQTQIAHLNQMSALAMAKLKMMEGGGGGFGSESSVAAGLYSGGGGGFGADILLRQTSSDGPSGSGGGGGGGGGNAYEDSNEASLRGGSAQFGDGREKSTPLSASGGGGRSGGAQQQRQQGFSIAAANNGGFGDGRESPLGCKSPNANQNLLPIGPTQSMSPARQKMLSLALANYGQHSSSLQRRSGARFGAGGVFGAGSGALISGKQPSAVAAADEILKAVAASAGGLRADTLTASSSSALPSIYPPASLSLAALQQHHQHMDPQQQLYHPSVVEKYPLERGPVAMQLHERRLAEMDAKFANRIEQINARQQVHPPGEIL